MRITIKTTNIEITEAISDYVEKKIRPLEKFVKEFGASGPANEIDERKGRVDVFIDIGKELGKSKGAFMSKAQVVLPGQVLVAKVGSYNLLESIDSLKDELQRKIVDYKKRPVAIKKRNVRVVKKNLKLDPNA